jgi:hypothetical protein
MFLSIAIRETGAFKMTCKVNNGRIFFILGFFSTLPSYYFFIALGILNILLLPRILSSKFQRNHPVLVLILLLLFFATASFIGIAYNQSEAHHYLIRSLLCVGIIFIYIALFNDPGDRSYNTYLLGLFAGILLNSIAVLIFSLSPEAYELLKIANFSGYDKGARLLRSPGLQTGTDTAGYLSVFGIVLYFYLKQRRVIHWLIGRKFFYLLLLAPIFCSRSSMLLCALTILLLLFFWGRVIRPLDKAIMTIYCFLICAVGIFFVGLLLDPESMGFISVTTEILPGVPLDSIYAVSDGDAYVDQYDFYHLFALIPIGNPSLYDNSVGKLLASVGAVGFLAGMAVLSYIIFGLLAIVTKKDRSFIVFFLLIYIYANFKNNYIFYSFFISMIALFFSRFVSIMRVPRQVCSNL